jgi:hypothetical protein
MRLSFYILPFGILIFWRTRRYKSIYNLKIDPIKMLIHNSKYAFFSALKRYTTSCHLLTKLELKAKTSVAQTGSQTGPQPYEYAKVLMDTTTKKCLYFIKHKLSCFYVFLRYFTFLVTGISYVPRNKLPCCNDNVFMCVRWFWWSQLTMNICTQVCKFKILWWVNVMNSSWAVSLVRREWTTSLQQLSLTAVNSLYLDTINRSWRYGGTDRTECVGDLYSGRTGYTFGGIIPHHLRCVIQYW